MTLPPVWLSLSNSSAAPGILGQAGFQIASAREPAACSQHAEVPTFGTFCAAAATQVKNGSNPKRVGLPSDIIATQEEGMNYHATGLHHVTACAGGAQEDIDFFTAVEIGRASCRERVLRLV